jgi:hypothetical protein
MARYIEVRSPATGDIIGKVEIGPGPLTSLHHGGHVRVLPKPPRFMLGSPPDPAATLTARTVYARPHPCGGFRYFSHDLKAEDL